MAGDGEGEIELPTAASVQARRVGWQDGLPPVPREVKPWGRGERRRAGGRMQATPFFTLARQEPAGGAR